MQDKIILGLLHLRDMTAYDLRKAIEGSTAFFYNASMGSIHPALKKLEAEGCVSAMRKVENGRAKKVYALSAHGREVFARWQGEGLPLEKFRDATLVRLFFLGNMAPDERRRHIAGHIGVLEEQIARLEAVQAGLDAPKAAAGAAGGAASARAAQAAFQLATLDFGLAYFRFARDWYREFLDKHE